MGDTGSQPGRVKPRGITGADSEQEHPPGCLINSHISAFTQVFIGLQHQVKPYLQPSQKILY